MTDEIINNLKEVQHLILCDKRFNIRKDFRLFNLVAQTVKLAQEKTRECQDLNNEMLELRDKED